MRKSIDLSDEQIKIVEEYKKRNGLKNFTKAIRDIIEIIGGKRPFPEMPDDISQKPLPEMPDDISDENMAIIGKVLLEINGKVDELIKHTAPRYVE